MIQINKQIYKDAAIYILGETKLIVDKYIDENCDDVINLDHLTFVIKNTLHHIIEQETIKAKAIVLVNKTIKETGDRYARQDIKTD